MPKGGQRIRIFSALEVANICGVVNQTAINWIRNGHLKAFLTPGGQYRIYAKDLAAFLDKRGMHTPGEVLQMMKDTANWKTFLVAAEQPVNDNLKGIIKFNFPHLDIIQAFDWFEVGISLTREKPGFVLLDAQLPGVDILKFLQVVKDDPAFGKPCVFVLTNGTADIPAGAADAVFSKPFYFEKLKSAMEDMEKQLNLADTA